ncbi:MAG: nucleoside hydrolase [Verrucomicrobia bacterium]|nr:nucleoside hydrolase [Verrucomicrobiota bacterium]
MLLLPLVVGLAMPGLVRAGTEVWIDTDCTLQRLRDVDDAFALVQALHAPELSIRGLSATYGNSSVEAALEATGEIVRRFGGPAGVAALPVHRGAASARALGERTPATEALAAALRERPLHYLALGPATNLATCLRLHPELRPRLLGVVLIAGRQPGERLRIGPWNPYPFSDANFIKDPAAVRELLEGGTPVPPLLLVPGGLARDCQLRPTDLEELATLSPDWAWLAAQCRLWLRTWRWLFGVEGGLLFDSVAVLAVTHPAQVQAEPRFARIEAADGRPRLVAAPAGPGAPARLVTQLKPGAADSVRARLRGRPTGAR